MMAAILSRVHIQDERWKRKVYEKALLTFGTAAFMLSKEVRCKGMSGKSSEKSEARMFKLVIGFKFWIW